MLSKGISLLAKCHIFSYSKKKKKAPCPPCYHFKSHSLSVANYKMKIKIPSLEPWWSQLAGRNDFFFLWLVLHPKNSIVMPFSHWSLSTLQFPLSPHPSHSIEYRERWSVENHWSQQDTRCLRPTLQQTPQPSPSSTVQFPRQTQKAILQIFFRSLKYFLL